MSSAKRKLAVGAAGLAVLAGTGGAYAATQSGSSGTKPDPATEQKAFLDDLANRLHVSSDQLTAAIKGAAEDRIDAAAKFLGLTEAELRTQLRSGKSLADIAKDKGKSVNDLKAAMKSAITSELDQAVKDGKLTADQRTKIEQNLDTALDRLINRTAPDHPTFRGFRRWR